MERQKIWVLIGALLMAFMAIEWMAFGGFGISVVLAVGLYLGWRWLAIRMRGKAIRKQSYLWLIPTALCTFCFVLFNNPVLKFFNILFLIGLLILQDLQLFETTEEDLFTIKGVLAHFFIAINLPFEYMDTPVEWIKEGVKEGGREKFKVIGKIFLGILIALPVLIVVVILLARADAAFYGVTVKVFESIQFDWGEWVIKIPLMIFCFFVFVSYFYGLQDETLALGMKGKESERTEPCLDFIIVGTVATLFCLVYIVFCFSQLAYFVSAFSGILPEDFTYAEYARRGFFETVPLTLFNLGMILVLTYMSKWVEGSKRTYIKGAMTLITGVTLFLVISALSKMGMYMAEYGLTLKRVYVAWFLSLIIVITLILFANLWCKKINVLKGIFISFTMMYLGLNYFNVDYRVAKQNISLYKTEGIEAMGGFYNLSVSAATPLQELVEEVPELGQEEHILMWISDWENQLSKETWESWNLASYKARRALQGF